MLGIEVRWARAGSRAGALHVCLVVGLLAMSACAGGGDTLVTAGASPQPESSPSGGVALFGMIQSEIFDQACTSGACHSSANRAGGLSLAAGESYDQLVNVDPENSTARAAGLKRVAPGSEAQSFLLDKLSGNLVSGEGSIMPLGTSGLSATQPDEFELIREWIVEGAPRDP